MALRVRVTIILVIIVGLAIILNVVAYDRLIWDNYLQLERDEAHKDVQRVLSAISREINYIDSLTHDWAAWDDSYQFVHDHNQEYIRSNLTETTFADNKLNLIGFYDTQGQPTWTRGWDLDKSSEIELAGFTDSTMFSAYSLLSGVLGDRAVKGIVLTKYGPLLLAIRPILNSGNKGPSRGFLVMGKLLTRGMVSKLVEITGVSFSAIRLDRPLPRPAYREIVQQLQTFDDTVLIPETKEYIQGYRLLHDLKKEPVLLLEAHVHRSIMHKARHHFEYILAITTIVGLMIILLLRIFLQRQVVGPVLALAQSVVDYRKGKTVSDFPASERKDEIGRLSREIKGLTDRIQEKTDDLNRTVEQLQYEVQESEKARIALENSEMRYRSLFDLSPEPILVLKQKPPGLPVIMDLNAAAVKMYGFTRDELMGKPIGFLDQPDQKKEVPGCTRQLTNGEIIHFETLHRRKNLPPTHVEVTACMFEIGGRNLVLAIHRNIDEQIRAKQEREHLEAQLRQSQKMEAVGRLAGGIAHDFNNLLTGIQGNLELAFMDAEDSSALQDDLDEIGKATRRAAELTGRLLMFSRKQIIDRKVVNMNGLIFKMNKMLIRLIGEHIELKTNLTMDATHVFIDPNQMEQVLVNLAINARDAMSKGGRLLISSDVFELAPERKEHFPDLAPGPYVRIQVSDTGHGMDETTRAQVFEPFFTTKPKGQGTGLGLSTVYGAIMQNGGHVQVDSIPGNGSIFTILLPRVEAGPEMEVPPKREEDFPTGTERILVAEDEKIIRDLMIRILQRLGYQARVAKDGREALEMIESGDEPLPDLLITDVVMPRMNGAELAKAVSEKYPEVRILFTSGYAENIIADHGALPKDTALLQKPLTPDILAKKIREILDGPR